MIELKRTITIEITSEIEDKKLHGIGSEKVDLGRLLEKALKPRIANCTDVKVTRITDRFKTGNERRVGNA